MYGDIDVTGKHTSQDDVSFLLGDRPTLYVGNVPGGTVTYQWTLPGDLDAVADYNPYGSYSVKTPLTDTTSQSLTFVWVDDGPNREIDVVVTLPSGQAFHLQAWFDVPKPSRGPSRGPR